MAEAEAPGVLFSFGPRANLAGKSRKARGTLPAAEDLRKPPPRAAVRRLSLSALPICTFCGLPLIRRAGVLLCPYAGDQGRHRRVRDWTLPF